MTSARQCFSASVAETEAIAAEFSRTLSGGECVALQGDLGAGKTQFVRGLVRGLGGDGRAVSSPTYVLLHRYDQGRLVVFHLDAYRVSGPDDFEAIGFLEMLEQGGVVVVEWAQRVLPLLPTDRIEINLQATGEEERLLSFRQPQTEDLP